MAKPKEAQELAETAEVQSKPNGRLIKRLLLHQPFTINGVTDQALYDHKGFVMTYHPEGVYGHFKGFDFIVPLANIVCVYF